MSEARRGSFQRWEVISPGFVIWRLRRDRSTCLDAPRCARRSRQFEPRARALIELAVACLGTSNKLFRSIHTFERNRFAPWRISSRRSSATGRTSWLASATSPCARPSRPLCVASKRP
ncbi:hypothetical protein AERO9AM_50208 [Aeromicrobium sp. 9AM]|nr:hypothetical protein AERO9AM_50208 [Aeromicrobium sp. 9AM]